MSIHIVHIASKNPRVLKRLPSRIQVLTNRPRPHFSCLSLVQKSVRNREDYYFLPTRMYKYIFLTPSVADRVRNGEARLVHATKITPASSGSGESSIRRNKVSVKDTCTWKPKTSATKVHRAFTSSCLVTPTSWYDRTKYHVCEVLIRFRKLLPGGQATRELHWRLR